MKKSMYSFHILRKKYIEHANMQRQGFSLIEVKFSKWQGVENWQNNDKCVLSDYEFVDATSI